MIFIIIFYFFSKHSWQRKSSKFKDKQKFTESTKRILKKFITSNSPMSLHFLLFKQIIYLNKFQSQEENLKFYPKCQHKLHLMKMKKFSNDFYSILLFSPIFLAIFYIFTYLKRNMYLLILSIFNKNKLTNCTL